MTRTPPHRAPGRASRRNTAAGAVAAALALAVFAVQAEDWQRDRFFVTVARIPVGEMVVESRLDGGQYNARMTLRATGLAGLVAPAHFEGQTTGTLAKDPANAPRFRPLWHQQQADTGRHVNSATIDFSGKLPIVTRAETLATIGETSADPPPSSAQLAQSIDPISVILDALRPDPATAPCDRDARVFDGTRIAQAATSAATRTGDTLRCDGTYTRLAGFSAAEMSERRVFRYLLVYTLTPGSIWQLDRIEADTLYGKARLKRR